MLVDVFPKEKMEERRERAKVYIFEVLKDSCEQIARILGRVFPRVQRPNPLEVLFANDEHQYLMSLKSTPLKQPLPRTKRCYHPEYKWTYKTEVLVTDEVNILNYSFEHQMNDFPKEWDLVIDVLKRHDQLRPYAASLALNESKGYWLPE